MGFQLTFNDAAVKTLLSQSAYFLSLLPNHILAFYFCGLLEKTQYNNFFCSYYVVGNLRGSRNIKTAIGPSCYLQTSEGRG